MAHILVAEDDPGLQWLIAIELETAGHAVDMVSDGRQLVDTVLQEEDPFDLIITDFNMPNRSGAQALAILRDQGIRTPVILFCDQPPEFLEKYRSAGFAAVVPKESTTAALIATINAVLLSKS
ncbi:MAG: response regulator [Candidatus Komeilibacteria bacterium]|nr:response regulator [Candidatus Komeilibacteria bacterium]